MLRRILLCLLISGTLFAQEEEIPRTNRVTITALDQGGKTLRSGLGFLYDSTTVIAAYSDVRVGAQVRVEWDGIRVIADRVVSFSESMDLAVLAAHEEIPLMTPIGASTTIGLGDRVSYWTNRQGEWELEPGTVQQILDTGKGYDLILIESPGFTTKPSPLYNESGKIVGWLQGKRAIPMETIAAFAERQADGVTINELHAVRIPWKFSKPSAVAATAPEFTPGETRAVSGPQEYPFRMELPGDWVTQVFSNSGRFHVRYERSGVVVEVRSIPLGPNEDIFSTLAEMENLVFTDFLRTELIPYSADYVTGFRGHYEESDAIDPYSLQVFYTAAAEKFYLLSVAYRAQVEPTLQPLIDQIFASFSLSPGV